MRSSAISLCSSVVTPLLLAALLTGCSTVSSETQPTVNPALEQGSGSFLFDATPGTRDRPLTVWYHQPATATSDSPVLFVMHGTRRNGEDYRDQWADLSDAHGFLLVVPEFSNEHYPGAESYNLGNMFTDGEPNDAAMWSYAAIEAVFDEVLARTGNRSERYFIYGHSAGSQFVHRFLMFQPTTRAEAAVTANAGWYTMPATEYDFPYGLQNLEGFQGRSVDAWVSDALQRPMVVLLGDADTDPDHASLRRTPEAMAQGEHRFARGHAYFAAAEVAAARLGVPFGWRLQTVPGVAHSNAQMAHAAVEALGW